MIDVYVKIDKIEITELSVTVSGHAYDVNDKRLGYTIVALPVGTEIPTLKTIIRVTFNASKLVPEDQPKVPRVDAVFENVGHIEGE